LITLGTFSIVRAGEGEVVEDTAFGPIGVEDLATLAVVEVLRGVDGFADVGAVEVGLRIWL